MSTLLTNTVTKREYILGIKTAPLELPEYGDYECPSCGDSYLVVKEVIRELGKNVVFIFRNFPLTETHPYAFDAALAVEAAALQNKFWEMYDLLFQNQARLSGHELFAFAKEVGLDMDRFEQDIQSQALKSKLKRTLKAD